MTRPETWSGSHLTSGAATAALPQTPPERPFGVHFQVTAAPPAHLLPSGYPSQGPPDRNNPALTPLAIAAVGISTALTALLTTMLIARMAKVSWREVSVSGAPSTGAALASICWHLPAQSASASARPH